MGGSRLDLLCMDEGLAATGVAESGVGIVLADTAVSETDSLDSHDDAMKVVENDFFPWFGMKSMTVMCWIFVHRGVKLTDVDVNHEAIHWEQWKECLIVLFPLLYLLMWLWEVVRCAFDADRGRKLGYYQRNGLFKRAYRSIAFEREAYAHEKDLEYLSVRKRYAWA